MIEFILSLMIVISFFFFYIRMSAVFAIANYIHYATFMSARTLSASTSSPDAQDSNAQAVMNSMVVGHFKTLITKVSDPQIGPGPFFNDSPLQDSWNQGVSYSFKAKLSLYPWNKSNQSIDIDLTSHSWMPREEASTDCSTKKNRVLSFLSQAGVNGKISIDWDNGGSDGC